MYYSALENMMWAAVGKFHWVDHAFMMCCLTLTPCNRVDWHLSGMFTAISVRFLWLMIVLQRISAQIVPCPGAGHGGQWGVGHGGQRIDLSVNTFCGELCEICSLPPAIGQYCVCVHNNHSDFPCSFCGYDGFAVAQ